MKKILKVVVAALTPTVMVLVILALLAIQVCRRIPGIPAVDGSRIQETIVERSYTPPVVPLPFVKDRAPVAREALPVPKKEVAKTVVVTQPDAEPVTLVIDKSGDVYVTTDTAPDVRVEVTRWNDPVLAFGPRLAFTLALAGPQPAPCLGVDLLRVWRFYLGVDVGLSGTKVLAGTAIRYRIADLGRMDACLTAGKDWLGNRLYAGVTVGWRF